MKTQKKIIVLEGPSGVGKDTIIRELIKQNPNIEKIVSYTTRSMRSCDVDGVTYNFTDTDTFLKKLKTGDIFEHTTRHGTYRGMSKTLINKIINNNKIAIKDCDAIGLHALETAYPNQVVSIFITASKRAVKKRLLGRKDVDIKARLKDYKSKLGEKNEYDYIVKNNKLEKTIKKIKHIMEKKHGTTI